MCPSARKGCIQATRLDSKKHFGCISNARLYVQQHSRAQSLGHFAWSVSTRARCAVGAGGAQTSRSPACARHGGCRWRARSASAPARGPAPGRRWRTAAGCLAGRHRGRCAAPLVGRTLGVSTSTWPGARPTPACSSWTALRRAARSPPVARTLGVSTST